MTGSGVGDSNDGYGNVTTSVTEQVYADRDAASDARLSDSPYAKPDLIATRGQAKLLASITKSVTRNTDGAISTSQAKVFNDYTVSGRLDDSQGASHTVADDGSGNITTSDVTDTYDLTLMNFGQNKRRTSHTTSETINRDNTVRRDDSTITFGYRGDAPSPDPGHEENWSARSAAEPSRAGPSTT